MLEEDLQVARRASSLPQAQCLALVGGILAVLPGALCLAQRSSDKALGGPAAAALDCPAVETANSQYSLFNPTPDRFMREMSTDRPDTTESPYTVPAGRFQLELSVVEFTYNDDGGERADALAILPANFKVGLLNHVDLQLVFAPYVRTETHTGEDEEIAEGFGDTQLRLKINLWGNDCPRPGLGNTALGFMPFIQFPSAADELGNDHLEGGLIFPLAVALPAEFSLGLMAEVDFVYVEKSDDYGVDFVHTATIGHDIAANLAGYIEYVGIATRDTGRTYQAIGSTGLTHAYSEDWIIDAGVTFGISNSADDISPFVGTSIRF